MSTNDYIKYITEQVVTYMNMPAGERKVQKPKHEESVYLTNGLASFLSL